MPKPRRRISTQWCVQSGMPTWHQQRAGHAFADSSCFWRKDEAKAYMRRLKKHHPNRPMMLTSRRVLRYFPR